MYRYISLPALYSHFGPINPSWHTQEPDEGSHVPSLSQSQKCSQLGPNRPLLHAESRHLIYSNILTYINRNY